MEELCFFDALEFHEKEFELLNEGSLDARRVIDVAPESGLICRFSQLRHEEQVAFQMFDRRGGRGFIRDAMQDGDLGRDGVEKLVVVFLLLSGADERGSGDEEDTRWEQTLHDGMIRGGSCLVKRFSPHL